MSYNVGDNPLKDLYVNLARAQEAQTTAKANEATAKETMDTLSESIQNGTSEGGVARQAATQAMVDMGNAYTAYNATLKPYEDANAALNSLLAKNPPASDAEIQSARSAAERALEARDNAYNAYVKSKEDWETKDAEADRAEGEDSVELEQAVADHGAAVQTSKEADDEVKEAEEAIAQGKADLIEDGYKVDENGQITDVPETEEAEKADGSQPIMTEAEAKAQGYTVIHSYEELLAIANDLNGKYMLMGDIQIPEGINWTPIGDANSPFKGEFNGNGCNILGLNIDVSADDVENIGFFGVTDGATISNLNIVDAKINGRSDFLGGTSNAGILVGLAKGTSFDNINASGTVNAYASAGGLIGAINDMDYDGNIATGNSIITNCNTDVNVNSQYYSGGLVGYVFGTENRCEDHRGIASQSLIIRNCHTSGSASVGEESAGGLIGEAGKTIITLDKCSSDMDLYWTNPEDDSDLSFLLETGRIGGMVGNINGSYITFANCEFNGSLNGDTEFQSEVYGWYMDDAHVAIYDLPAGLPVNDILNIDGIDGMQATGDGKYLCTVSTLSGLDKMVGMIKANPELADKITWQINFDFNAMDGAYDYSDYAQYGIVQHLYEDEEGNTVNDVYIDNECDLESTYHAPEGQTMDLPPCNGNCCPDPIYPTMVPGLWKNDAGDYFVLDELGGRHQVTFDINANDQITNIDKRLTTSEVEYRERLVELGEKIQQQMRDVLKDIYNWNKEESVPIITKAEYKKLAKKAEKYGYDSLTEAEKLSMAVFEVDYDIMNAQAKYTKNLGCGMGGNASFLDKTTTHQMYDADGNALFTTLDGDSLIGIYDDAGNITGYKYSDSGEPYYGMGDVFEQRGYQNTDEDGNLLFTHTAEDGTSSTVTQIKGEDGAVSYVTTDADGNQVPFEGDVDSLERQLTPANYSEDYANFQSDLEKILQDVKDGNYPKGRTSGDNTITDGESADVDGDGDVDENDKKPDEV